MDIKLIGGTILIAAVLVGAITLGDDIMSSLTNDKVECEFMPSQNFTSIEDVQSYAESNNMTSQFNDIKSKLYEKNGEVYTQCQKVG